MANQPKITATFEFDWSIDRKIWNIWSESVSKDAIQSPLFGPDCFGSTKFQLKLSHSSVLKEYKLILVLVSIDDSENGLEVKCKKINRNETEKDLVNHSYTRMEVGSRCEIWKSAFAPDLFESFFEKIHFEFKCKVPYKTNSKSQSVSFEPKKAQSVGKNFDKSSDKPRHRQDSATVALQNMQTIDHLHKILLESKKEFQELISDANTKIVDLMQQNEQVKEEFSTLKQNNEESNAKIVEADAKMVDLRQQNEQFNREIGILKQNNEESNKKILDANNKIAEAETRITYLTPNPVPIGFIYVQLSSQDEPRTLWPTVEWADVTTEYAGLFFRAEGADSEKFGTVQEANLPIATETRKHNNTYSNTYSNRGEYYDYSLQSYQTGGELRPRNSAIRIWKRIK